MENHEPIWRQIHYPALVVCLGTVFMAPLLHREQGRLICVKWTILSVAMICACTLYGIMRHHDNFASEGKIAKSVYLVGMIEVVISFLQSTKVLVSYNPFFAFTGTFSNPSMLAILLSICIPIGVFYVRQHASRERLLWIMATLSMVACLLFSASRTCTLAVLAACVVFSLGTGCSLLRFSMRNLFLLVVVMLPLTFLFLLKRDSTNGRVLIWANTLRMIMDRPLLGWGTDGFGARYMTYQAEYFAGHPQSEYADLADNITHPLSEYLLLAVDYGLVGLAVAPLAVFLLMRMIRRGESKYRRLYFAICVSVAVCSLFSYPFRMPFVWIVTAYMACVALRTYSIGKARYFAMSFLAVSIMALSCKFAYRMGSKWRWASLQDNSHQGLPDDIVREYESLYGKLHSDSYFLYNYGTVLHRYGRYEESVRVLQECAEYYNDYNVQMLLGDDYRQQGMSQEAVERFFLSSKMIPNRFLPLYYEMETYMENGEQKKACHTANVILQKRVKIKNVPAVGKIRDRAKQIIEEVGHE